MAGRKAENLNKTDQQYSRDLSRILRYNDQYYRLPMNDGYVDVSRILRLNEFVHLTVKHLRQIVRNSHSNRGGQPRFQLVQDPEDAQLKIRASYIYPEQGPKRCTSPPHSSHESRQDRVHKFARKSCKGAYVDEGGEGPTTQAPSSVKTELIEEEWIGPQWRTRLPQNRQSRQDRVHKFARKICKGAYVDEGGEGPTTQAPPSVKTEMIEEEWEKYIQEGTHRTWFFHPETCESFYGDDVESGWEFHRVWVNAAEGRCFIEPDDDGLCM